MRNQIICLIAFVLICNYVFSKQNGIKFLSDKEEDSLFKKDENKKQKNEIFTGETCQVLILEGGGDNGAYQAGSLKALLESKEAYDVDYDVITGISLGAFNAAILATTPYGEEKNAATYIENSWKILKKEDIYKNWIPFGIIEGIAGKQGFYNTMPEYKKMQEVFKNRKLERNLIICATNVATGIFECFNNDIMNKYGIEGAIMATTAYPPIFPSFKYIGHDYFDGTIKHSIEFVQAINSCIDHGFTRDKIVVDILLCNSPKITQYSSDNYFVFNALMRSFEIFAFDLSVTDYEYYKRIFSDVKIRYLVEPSQELPDSHHPYEFDKSKIDFMINLGYTDAQKVINNNKKNN